MHQPSSKHFKIVIVGSGFAGLGAAIRLLQRGEQDFVVLERASDVGGVWRDNSYPGCACDVQSHLYSFSFAPKPDWSRAFSPQPEILAYLRECARSFGVLPHLRFQHEVLSAAWDEEARSWRITTSAGTYTASILIAGMGGLNEPSIPKLPGLERFAGKVFHSARWDHAHDLTGRRVGVIGTGASAIQFVPEIQPLVGKLHLFQRTPAWVIPRVDRPISSLEKHLFGALPATEKLVRGAIYWRREAFLALFRNPRLAQVLGALARQYLRRTVRDPELRRKLTPSFVLGCKRILISNDYLPALTRANVEVVTEGIREVLPHAVVTDDGREHQVDTLIFGTGFHVSDAPFSRLVRGRDGRSLAEAWEGSPKAHWATTVAGFPNLFLLVGPNSGSGHTSIIVYLESQLQLVMEALEYMQRKHVGTLEPKAEAQARFVQLVDELARGTVWTTGGCSSYYLDATGRNSALWPSYSFAFRRGARFRPEEYELDHATSRSSLGTDTYQAAQP